MPFTSMVNAAGLLEEFNVLEAPALLIKRRCRGFAAITLLCSEEIRLASVRIDELGHDLAGYSVGNALPVAKVL